MSDEFSPGGYWRRIIPDEPSQAAPLLSPERAGEATDELSEFAATVAAMPDAYAPAVYVTRLARGYLALRATVERLTREREEATELLERAKQLLGESQLATLRLTRERDEAREDPAVLLAGITRRKAAAVNALEWYKAAELRGAERWLEQEVAESRASRSSHQEPE